MNTPIVIAIIAGISGGVISVLGLGFFSVEVPTVQDIQLELDPKEKCKVLTTEYYGILRQYGDTLSRVEQYPPDDQKRIWELMPQIAGGCNGVLSDDEMLDLMIELKVAVPP